MIKYCLQKWEENKDRLEQSLRTRTDLNDCCYMDLVKLVVHDILNGGETEFSYNKVLWDTDKITEIDNGDYQGTLLYLIPSDTYQPSEYDYLMTYVDYGSCCGCDTLQHIQYVFGAYDNHYLTDEQIPMFMKLCKDLITNMIKPYNHGWRKDEVFDPIEMD